MAVIKERRQFQIGKIGVARASEGGRIIGSAISNSANQLTSDFFRRAAFEAEKKGIEAAESVVRDEVMAIDPTTGKSQAFSPPKGFGQIATEAYQRVVMRRFQQSYDDEIQNKAKELAVKYESNPNGVALYESAMSDYMAEMSNNAEGAFKTYIQDVGTAYLNATKTSLSIAQIRRERVAAAKAQAQAVENGLEAYESMIAQGGPSVLKGPTVANNVGLQVQNTINDGVDSGLFDEAARSTMGESSQLAQARGLIRYALSQADNDPDQLKLLQHAIGTQNAGAVPKEFSYVADAMRSLGSNYSALSELEKFSDGLLSDAVQAAEVIESQKKEEIEAQNAMSIFDLEQNGVASAYNARAKASGYDPRAIVNVAISEYNNATSQARDALANNNKDLSDAILKRRDSVFSAHVEGLMLQAVDGLTREETNQLESAVFQRDAFAAPKSSRKALLALIDLNSKVDSKVLDGFLPFIGSYRDAAGKYVEVSQSVEAANKASEYDVIIDSIDKTRGANTNDLVSKSISNIQSIKNLDDPLRNQYLNEIRLRGAQASINEFFEGNPTKQTAIDAYAYLNGQAPSDLDLLSKQQIALLDQASNYAKQSGTENTIREHFNRGASINNDRIAAAEKQQKYNENILRANQGQLDPKSVTDQKFLDTHLTEQFSGLLEGKPLSTFWSDTAAQQTEQGQLLLNVVSGLNAMPLSLKESLSSLASGNFLGGDPTALLSSYMNYKDYNYLGANMLSPMMTALEPKQIAMLDYLADSARLVGSDPNFLARAFSAKSELERDPNYKKRVESFLGTNLDDFVSKIDNIEDAPSSAYNAMKAATLDLIGISQAGGLTLSGLEERLERQLENSYPSGDGIVFGPNFSERTVAPLSYAAPKNEDLFKQYIINEVTKAQPTASPPQLGITPSALELTAATVLLQEAGGNVFLQPIGVPTAGRVQYAVYRITKPEEGGYELVYSEAREAGPEGQEQTIRVPLIVSNKDKVFLDMVSKRASREKSDAMGEARRKYSIPKGIPSDALGGAIITGGKGMFSFDTEIGLEGPKMELY